MAKMTILSPTERKSVEQRPVPKFDPMFEVFMELHYGGADGKQPHKDGSSQDVHGGGKGGAGKKSLWQDMQDIANDDNLTKDQKSQKMDAMKNAKLDKALRARDAKGVVKVKGKINYQEVDQESFNNAVQPWIDDNARKRDGSIDYDRATEALWAFADKTDIPKGVEFPEEWNSMLDEAISALEDDLEDN